MATPTYAELVATYKQGIKAIVTGGQSYQIGARQFRRADLGEMMKTLKQLEWLAAEESGASNGGSSLAQLDDINPSGTNTGYGY